MPVGISRSPELTIAVGLLDLGVAAYLASSLLLDGGDLAAPVAVFTLLRGVPSSGRETR